MKDGGQAPFFVQSLTLVPRSLLLNRTETLATQAIPVVASHAGVFREARISSLLCGEERQSRPQSLLAFQFGGGTLESEKTLGTRLGGKKYGRAPLI